MGNMCKEVPRAVHKGDPTEDFVALLLACVQPSFYHDTFFPGDIL